MITKYWQKGETLDYTPAAAVKNGAVVNLESRIGIAASTIAANAPGHIHVTGVFEMDKDSGEIKMGDSLFYNPETDKITKIPGVPAGYAAASAAASAVRVLVNIGGADCQDAAHSALILKDAAGNVYDITISEAGALTATKRIKTGDA